MEFMNDRRTKVQRNTTVETRDVENLFNSLCKLVRWHLCSV